MRWEKDAGPAYTVLKVHLEPGETVYAEPGAMMLIRGDVEARTSSGGILRGLKRALLGGESFFINEYRARSAAEIWFVPGTPGDIEAIELRGDEWWLQDYSYLAHSGSVEVTAGWRGLRGLLAEGELFWLRVRGRGVVWVSSYGAIRRISLGPGERMVVDNYHLVALSSTTRYTVRKFGGLKTFLFGGEGLVVEAEGPGELLVQTRILPPFANLLARFLPERRG